MDEVFVEIFLKKKKKRENGRTSYRNVSDYKTEKFKSKINFIFQLVSEIRQKFMKYLYYLY